MADEFKLVAPDGGWGWMVVLAMAVNNLITIPILQNFGLLFRDVFSLKSVEITLQEASIIINTNSAFGYILGILNGPILRNLGYRKVAMAGALMMFVGLFVTSFANLFIVFFIFYGLINSLGIGWSMASHHLALSTYFVKKRTMAMGLAMTVTGLGPVIMPLVISKLMDFFGARGTSLLLSGLVLNTLCCAMLLQPIKWHRKRAYVCEILPHSAKKPHEEEAMLDKSTENGARRDKIIPQKPNRNRIELVDVADQKDDLFESEKVDKDNVTIVKKRWYHTVVQTFDLDLLQDLAFLSMCVGMSIALAADMNFSLMLPFILGDYNYDIHTTATVQSVVGIADIVSRLLTPFILRKSNISARVAYLCSLFCLIITRFCLTLTSDLYSVMLVVFLFGVSKGVRAVFMPLVIPNYVPLDKLPSALGLQNIFHGLLLMMLGPLIGFLREKTGNFILCIHVMNSMTAVTILLWALEFVYMRSKKKNTFEDVVDEER